VAIINEKIYSKSSTFIEKSEIAFVCPICKATKTLEFPNSVINEAKQLTTISIPKGLMCEHHFQAFVDKNFKVRGYQKVDYEFKFEGDNQPNSHSILQNEKDVDLFRTLILEGNYVKYTPLEINKKEILKDTSRCKFEQLNTEDLTLSKIYDEFWEFIDDNNITFKKYIEKDTRRKRKIEV